MLSQHNKTILLNAVCAGTIAGLATKYFIGEIEEVKFYGMELNAPVATGVSVGASSVVSDLSADLVIKKLGLNNQIQNASILAVQAGLAGGASAGILYLSGMPASGITTAVAIGAGSKLGGDWAQIKLFDPKNGVIGAII